MILAQLQENIFGTPIVFYIELEEAWNNRNILDVQLFSVLRACFCISLVFSVTDCSLGACTF